MEKTIEVFPTYVGVDRTASSTAEVSMRIPHVCGGGPSIVNTSMCMNTYSPRMWGWTER